jgi:hypothetical protein
LGDQARAVLVAADPAQTAVALIFVSAGQLSDQWTT